MLLVPYFMDCFTFFNFACSFFSTPTIILAISKIFIVYLFSFLTSLKNLVCLYMKKKTFQQYMSFAVLYIYAIFTRKSINYLLDPSRELYHAISRTSGAFASPCLIFCLIKLLTGTNELRL